MLLLTVTHSSQYIVYSNPVREWCSVSDDDDDDNE